MTIVLDPANFSPNVDPFHPNPDANNSNSSVVVHVEYRGSMTLSQLLQNIATTKYPALLSVTNNNSNNSLNNNSSSSSSGGSGNESSGGSISASVYEQWKFQYGDNTPLSAPFIKFSATLADLNAAHLRLIRNVNNNTNSNDSHGTVYSSTSSNSLGLVNRTPSMRMSALLFLLPLFYY